MSPFPGWLAFFAAGCLVLLSGRFWWQSRAPIRNARRARRKGARGEKRARVLLAQAGYHVLDEQVGQRVEVHVDGKPVTSHLRADFLVERAGRRYIADAKSGPKATSVQNASTRRQLLEYALVFDVEGILLIDTHTDQIREIVFPALGHNTSRSTLRSWRHLLIGALIGVLAAELWHLLEHADGVWATLSILDR